MAKKTAGVVRLADIAEKAGVSRAAVSHALHGRGTATVRVSEPTRQRILEAAAQLNYHPNRIAQQLRGMPSDMLGVIVDTWDARVTSDRLAAVEEEAARRGLRLMIGQSHGDDVRLGDYLADFDGRQVRGILCLLDMVAPRYERLRAQLREGLNIVFHGLQPGTVGGYVHVDVTEGVRLAMAHLRQRGRRRPCMVLTDTRDYRTEMRRKTFCEALAPWGLAPEPHVWLHRGAPIEPVTDVLDQIIETLVARQGGDALVTADDIWGVRIVQRLKQRGYRVPEDVALVGYDNLDLATVIDPPLTTIDQNHQAYAQAAVELLLAIHDDPRLPPARRHVVIAPRLVVRGST